MKIAASVKRQYPAKPSIFMLVVAFLVGTLGYGGSCGGDGCGGPPCPTPPPSQNLEIQTWYDLDAVRDNLAGNHTLMNDLDATTAGYQELAGRAATTEAAGTRSGHLSLIVPMTALQELSMGKDTRYVTCLSTAPTKAWWGFSVALQGGASRISA